MTYRSGGLFPPHQKSVCKSLMPRVMRASAHPCSQSKKEKIGVSNNVAGAWAGLTAGAALRGKVGAGLGIARGPLGAIAGTIPGLIVGGIIGYFSGAKAGEQVSR